mgnify:CR=1 FL=1
MISVGLVETFDVGILCGLARLNVSKADLVYPAPDFSDICYKLRSITHADLLMLSVAVHQMVQYPDYPRTFQAVISLNVKDSRLKSSITLKLRNFLPFESTSLIKSILHV